MKKALSYILISMIIFANLFAPISVGLGEKNKIRVIKNEASAAGEVVYIGVSSTTDHSVGIVGGFFTTQKFDSLNASYNIGTTNPLNQASGATFFGINEPTLSDVITKDASGNNVYRWDFGYTIDASSLSNANFKFALGNTYYIEVRIRKTKIDTAFLATSAVESFVLGTPSTYGVNTYMPDDKTRLTDAYNNALSQGVSVEEAQKMVNSSNQKKILADKGTQDMPVCGFIMYGTVAGCVAQIVYYALFVPTSYLFALAGTFFDNTFSYSVQSSSYKSSFVVQGWGLVRDFCNMFFIFIMLYIAISTILNIHGFNTKSTIINVIVIGLFINFSLFATQIIIDSSNIMARVFYNSDAIKITESGVNGATGVISAVGPDGIIPLSAALVNKVNPQNIIINSSKIGQIPDLGGKAAAVSLGAGTFILITLLSVGINIVGFVIFLSVGLVFVVRVVGLWVAMILSPLAFFTYILPEQMAGWKMVGWKNWWPETLKMAFMAPIFIFFLYIILKFLELDLISNSSGKTGIPFVISTMIPFAFIMVLMMKAKKIAVDMSGEMGSAVAKIGGAASGLVLGAGVGLGAMAMKGTIGRLGSAVANSDRVKKWEREGKFGAATLRNIGTKAGTGSFDIRNTKAGALAGSGLEVNLGKGKEGGFVKARADKTAARQKRAKELELGPDSPEMIALRAASVQQKNLENKFNSSIDVATADVAAARQNSIDADAKLRKNPEDVLLKAAAKDAQDKYDDAKEKLANISSGGEKLDKNGVGTGEFNTNNGKISEIAYKEIIKKETEAKSTVTNTETNLQTLKLNSENIKNTLQKEIDAIEKTKTDAINALGSNVHSSVKLEIEQKANKEIEAAKARSSEAISKSDMGISKAENDLTIANSNLAKISQKADAARTSAADGFGVSIKEAKIEAHHAQDHVNKINNEGHAVYAKTIQSDFNKVINMIASGGVHSSHGADEAADKIRLDLKIESSGGGHGGGDHGGGHSAPATPKATATAKAASSGGGGHSSH